MKMTESSLVQVGDVYALYIGYLPIRKLVMNNKLASGYSLDCGTITDVRVRT
jgi:hypothetical protein